MTFYGAVADLLDPPPPLPDLATPSGFAEAHSRGRWHRAPHLDLVEREVLDCIETSGRLIVSVSVRHGKSEYVSKWLPPWYLGTHPNKRVVLAGHEADFASRWGRAARDILTEHGHRFDVGVSPRSEAANRWDLAAPHDGGMFTLGVGGAVIGRGADLLIVDDPVKSFEDAMSPLKRRRVKEWWTGTMETRIEPGGAVVLVMARWHEDDLAGFLLKEAPDEWREVRLPAIADDPDDPLGRAPGEPLWPERYPLAELERRKKATSLLLGEQVWLAQYQQRPTTPKGGMFPDGKWAFAPAVNHAWEPIQWVRRWDLAATEEGGDWTVGVLMGKRADGRFVVGDVRRGRWASSDVRQEIRVAAGTDPDGTRIVVPQDPGQAGKDQAEQLVAMLAGFAVATERETGSKEVRAAGYAAQQQAGNVTLVEGDWNGAFTLEHTGFPKGTHDDQVDAAAGAFNALVGTTAATVTSYRSSALQGTR